jgi:hypothetical protein
MAPIIIKIRVSRMWRFRVWLSIKMMEFATHILPQSIAVDSTGQKITGDIFKAAEPDGRHLH